MTQAKNKSDSSLRYWHVVEELRRMLKDTFASSFKGLVLYGSHARGEPDEESDIDLLVLFKDRAAAMRADARVSELALRLSSERNELVSTVTMGEREYQEGRSPFFLNVKREGILIVPDEVFNMSPEIARLLEMARESLDVANGIFEREHYGFAASRAYYAMFYAAEAALLAKGLSYSRHSGVIAGFGQHFAREGLQTPELHRSLQNSFRLRNQGDYSIEPLTSDMAEPALNDARKFVEAVETYINSIFEG